MCFHKGQPSVKKCRKVREKREQAQEIAELDVSNIITTQGKYFCITYKVVNVKKKK